MLEGIAIADLTAPGLLGLTVLLLLLGKIIPRSVYRDKALEAERWQNAYNLEREARITSDAQTGELLEVAKTTHALITAMLGNSAAIRQQGEAHALDQKG